MLGRLVVFINLCVMLALGSASQASPILYAANDTNLLAVDLTAHTSTVVGALGVQGTHSLAFDADGTLYSSRWYSVPFGTLYRELRTVNTTTGASTLAANLTPSNCVEGAAFQPGTGILYGEDYNTGQFVQIDPTTGIMTNVGPIGMSPYEVSGLAFGPNGVLYGVHNFGNVMVGDNYRLVTFNLTTGSATVIGTSLGLGSYQTIGDIAFDPSGTLYCVVANTGDIRTIDTTTGLAGPIVYASAASGAHGLAFTPEPTAALLLVLGAVAVLRRR